MERDSFRIRSQSRTFAAGRVRQLFGNTHWNSLGRVQRTGTSRGLQMCTFSCICHILFSVARVLIPILLFPCWTQVGLELCIVEVVTGDGGAYWFNAPFFFVCV
jgi:hypothetical protein